MKKLLLCSLIVVLYTVANGQINYLAVNAINTNGGYTDLGANGTVITTAGFDDDNSAAQDIGFNFVFNNTTFSQFVLNTNGAIKLGSTAPAAANITDALASGETNLLYPLNLDLVAGSAPEYRVFTSGTAPNRLCTIQFKNVSDYNAPPVTTRQFSDMNFQVRLYETSNNIEFVYGDFVAGTAASASLTTRAGIKGDNAAASLNAVKASNGDWSTTTFIDGNYVGIAHNIRNTFLPAPGQTYVFRSNSALPVSLTDFNGSMQGTAASLSWITNRETNNDSFEVQRATTGSVEWLTVGQLLASADPGIIHRYTFADQVPGDGRWLYRLKIIDKSGKIVFSPVITLQSKGKPTSTLSQNYPNPVSNVTMIGYQLASPATVTIELYGLNGQKLMIAQKGKQTAGDYNYSLDVQSLSLNTGKYIYRLVVQDIATGKVTSEQKEMLVVR